MIRITIALLLAGGCSKDAGQSFHDGMQALCDLPDHVLPPDQPAEQRVAAAMRWAANTVTNAEAKQAGSLDGAAANQATFSEAVTKAGIAHCKFLDNGMAFQSFAEAVALMCDTPTDPQQASIYIHSRFLHPEVIRTMAALPYATPEVRRSILVEFMQRAGIKDCAMLRRLDAKTP